MFKRAMSLVVLGLFAVGCASASDNTADTASMLTTTVTLGPSATGPAGPVVVAGKIPTDDAALLGYAYALMLQNVTRQEMVAFFSTNIPEDEVASCMSAAGFDYVPGATPEEQVAEDVRYTMSPEEYAATYGLGVTGWQLGILPAVESTDAPADAGLSKSQSAAYTQTLGQCRGMFDPARRAFSDAVSTAVDQFRGVVDSDERMVAGLAAWHTCMATAGYEFDTPMTMRDSFYARMNTTDENLKQIFDDEVRVAVANVPCEAAYLDVQRDVISSRFTEFKAMFDAALASGAASEAPG
jgi:hypothetical protein